MVTINYLLTSLIIVLIPGTGVIYTISTGLIYKEKKSIYAAFGCTLGIIPHLIASILGLTALMNISAQIFSIIKYLGSGYLLFLAWKTWRHAGEMKIDGAQVDKNDFSIIRRGIMLNLLNPKLTIFFLSFLPQFISIDSTAPAINMLILSLIFMAMTLVVFVFYGLIAAKLQSVIMNNKRLMKNIERSFSVIFASLAVKLAFSENS